MSRFRRSASACSRPADETRDAVQAALSTGYRHIDTAAAYGKRA
ncbi:hypothetical protein [Winogradskya consettensis]|nr:hypothetical protein [Actinoplanes consettensis]